MPACADVTAFVEKTALKKHRHDKVAIARGFEVATADPAQLPIRLADAKAIAVRA
jgi:hypothetical protein